MKRVLYSNYVDVLDKLDALLKENGNAKLRLINDDMPDTEWV